MEPLETVDLTGVEVFSAGSWNGDAYSEADLDAMVDAFGKVGFKPTIKAGHADGQEDEKTARKVFGAPALGYVSRLYRKGEKLIADLIKIPKKFSELIKAGAYSRISSEIYWKFSDDVSGKIYPRVLKSVAFLGAEIPAVTSLDSALDLYYKRNAAGGLYAYDGGGNEFRVYCMECAASPSPMDSFSRFPRKEKVVVNYRSADSNQERCGNCKFYVFLNACSLVEGWIDPNYTSDYFELRSDLIQQFAENREIKEYTIEKRDNKWCLISKSTGKTLGCHDTEDAALAQERAVQANKSSNDKAVKTNNCKCEEVQMVNQYAEKKKKYTDIVEKEGQFCIMDGESVQECFPTMDEAKAKAGGKDYERGDIAVDIEAERKKLQEDFDKKLVALKADFEKQTGEAEERAKIQARAEFEMDAKDKDARISKLERERKEDRINSWIKDRKAEGKLLPVEEERVKQMLFSLPEGGEKVVKFSQEGKQVEETTAEAIMKLFEARTASIFKIHSRQGTEDDSPSDPDPTKEVLRRAEKYQKEHPTVSSLDAMKSVLNEDKDLARRYHALQQ